MISFKDIKSILCPTYKYLPQCPDEYYKYLGDYLGRKSDLKLRMEVKSFTKASLDHMFYLGCTTYVPWVSVSVNDSDPTVLDIRADGVMIQDWLGENWHAYD